MNRKQLAFIIFITFIVVTFIIVLVTQAHANGHHDNHHDCFKSCYESGPTPTITPTITPIPTIDPCQEENVDNPCITPTPTATPSPTPGDTNQGSSPTPDGQKSTTDAPGAPSCTIAFDGPKLQGFHADGNGSVTFSWWGVQGVDKYSIRYGYQPNQLVYGADNIPSSSTSFQINGLNPGSNVWAIVTAWKNGCGQDSNLLDPKVK